MSRLALLALLLLPVLCRADPTPNSQAAATWTAQHNRKCTAVAPFYAEIGNATTAPMWSVNSPAGDSTYTRTTLVSVASVSKLPWAAAFVAFLGAAPNAAQAAELNFTAGYIGPPSTNGLCKYGTGGGQYTSFAACVTANPTVLNQTAGAVGNFYYAGNQISRGVLDYLDSGSGTGFGNMYNNTIGNWYGSVRVELGAGLPNTQYSSFDGAGGMYTNAVDLAVIGQRLLAGGSLLLSTMMSTDCVCTVASCNPGTTYTPMPEKWSYCLGHWIENDPNFLRDGAFTSPGGYGADIWIDKTQTYYGLLIEQQAVFGEGNGYNSAQCDALIRNAWMTGFPQVGAFELGPLSTG